MPRSLSQHARGQVTAAKAISLRLTGATYAEIGQALGISAPGACKAVARALQDLRPPDEVVEEHRTLELLRLDRLQQAHWDAALQGNLPASEFCLRVIDRRIRLLGLESQRLEVTGKGGAPIAIEDLREKLLRRLDRLAEHDQGSPPQPARD